MPSLPPMNPKHIYNDLYRVLVEYFPDYRSKQNVFDVPRFARDLGKSNETVYKALRADKLHVGVAHAMLTFSHENYPEMPLYWDDVIRFILPDFVKLSDPVLASDD